MATAAPDTATELPDGSFGEYDSLGEYDENGLFHRSLAHLCDSELPLDRALQLAASDLADGRVRRSVLAMAEDVARGGSFADSYRRHGSGCNVYAALVEAGLACDELPAALDEIAREERFRASLRDKLETALARPLMSAIVVGVVGLLVLFVVLPWGAQSERLDIRALLGFGTPSEGMSNEAWLAISGVALGLVVSLSILLAWTLRRGISAERLARVPVLRALGEQAQRARFASTLAMLLRREMPLDRALRLASEALGSSRLASDARRAVASAAAGGSLTSVLTETRLLSPDLCFYVASQEPRGDVAGALVEIAKVEEQRFERHVATVSKVAGPAIELAVGLVVLCFALGYLHPALRLFSDIMGR